MARLLTPPTVRRTLRALAWLLRYPDATARAALPELAQALLEEGALSFGRSAELAALIRHLQQQAPLQAEAQYVALFDRGRRTALHLFEHVHGDSRDRGNAMVSLQQTYDAAGLQLSDGELPDHLCVVLEYASTQPEPAARAFLLETAPVLQQIFSALLEQKSPYASVIAAVLDLAGERARAVPLASDPSLDESWAEPEAFGGCSSAGQARPDTPQPIHIVRAGART